jgi:hypothetical protein
MIDYSNSMIQERLMNKIVRNLVGATRLLTKRLRVGENKLLKVYHLITARSNL